MDTQPAAPDMTVPVTNAPIAPPPKPRSVFKIALMALVAIAVLASITTTLILLRGSPAPTPVTQESSPSPATAELTLTLTSPADGEPAYNKEILVKGKTAPNTPVVMFTDNDETSVESAADGAFEGTIILAPGINTLTVTAYGEDDKEMTVTKDIVYDTET